MKQIDAEITGYGTPLTFEVTSGALRVTDPCYDTKVWCSGQIENVKNGKWIANVGYYKDPFDEEMFQKYIEEERKEIETFKKSFGESGENYAKVKTAQLDERIERAKNRPGRVSIICITHESYIKGLIDNYEDSDIHVGVDSGQAGFFDLAKYKENFKEDGKEKSDKFDSFYEEVCDITLQESSWGVVPFGAVSSSGYGDGGYNCYVAKNDDGEIISAYIVFISKSDAQGDEDE